MNVLVTGGAGTVAGIIACTQKEFGFEVFNLGNSDAVKLSYLSFLKKPSAKKPSSIANRCNRAMCHLLARTFQRRSGCWAMIRKSKSKKAFHVSWNGLRSTS